MEDKLRSGTTLIVDRYSYSGVAFSSAKELDLQWCKVTWSLFNAYYLIVTVLVSIPVFFVQAPEKGLLAPDLVVYLDILPEVKPQYTHLW